MDDVDANDDTDCFDASDLVLMIYNDFQLVRVPRATIAITLAIRVT